MTPGAFPGYSLLTAFGRAAPLNLDYQLDDIDYTRPNFVHADLDAETFQQLQSERGESFAQLILTSLSKAMSDPSAGRDVSDLVGGALHELDLRRRRLRADIIERRCRGLRVRSLPSHQREGKATGLRAGRTP